MFHDDAGEVWASSHLTPDAALKRAYLLSTKTWSAFYNDELVGIFGVGPIDETGLGCPWFLRTVHFAKVPPRVFLPVSRACAAWLEEGYTRLTNRVWSRNTTTKRWLEHLGFTLGKRIRVQHGENPGHYFNTFYKETPCATSLT